VIQWHGLTLQIFGILRVDDRDSSYLKVPLPSYPRHWCYACNVPDANWILSAGYTVEPSEYKHLLLPLFVAAYAVCSSLIVILIQIASILSRRAIYLSNPLNFVMPKKKLLTKRIGKKASAEPHDEAPALLYLK
jgi:hypothetical protein